MSDFPYNLYRPARVSDGQGGWTATWANPIAVFGACNFEGFTTQFSTRAETILYAEDVIEAEGRFWRVTERGLQSGGPRVSYTIVECERPQIPGPTTTPPGTTTP